MFLFSTVSFANSQLHSIKPCGTFNYIIQDHSAFWANVTPLSIITILLPGYLICGSLSIIISRTRHVAAFWLQRLTLYKSIRVAVCNIQQPINSVDSYLYDNKSMQLFCDFAFEKTYLGHSHRLDSVMTSLQVLLLFVYFNR